MEVRPGGVDRDSYGGYEISQFLGYASLTMKKMQRDMIASGLRIGCFSRNRFNHQLGICSIAGSIRENKKKDGRNHNLHFVSLFE